MLNFIQDIKHQLYKHPVIGAGLCGGSVFFAFAPFFVWPIFLCVAPVLLALIAHVTSRKTLFLSGVAFLSGVVVAHFFWGFQLAEVFLSATWPYGDGGSVYIAVIVAVLLFFVPSMVVFGGVFVALGCFLEKMPSLMRPWVFALAMTMAELCIGLPYRDRFPWFSAGYSVSDNIYLMQAASVGSVAFLSFLIWGISASVAHMRCQGSMRFASMVFCCWLVFGVWRVETQHAETDRFVPLRLVQANMDVAQTLTQKGRRKTLLHYVTVSEDLPVIEDKLTIWAESAVPFFLEEYPAARDRFQSVARPEILAGGFQRAFNAETGEDNIYNASLLLNAQGDVVQAVRKQILVPFGEYFPLRQFFDSLYKIFLSSRIDFTAGHGAPVIHSATAGDIVVLNCYEVLFPAFAARFADQGQFLLHLSNDAWFLNDFAREAIFYIARMRSVETGKPLVRVANKGRHAIFDGYGRIVFQKDSDFAEIHDVRVPIGQKTQTIWTKIVQAVVSFKD